LYRDTTHQHNASTLELLAYNQISSQSIWPALPTTRLCPIHRRRRHCSGGDRPTWNSTLRKQIAGVCIFIIWLIGLKLGNWYHTCIDVLIIKSHRDSWVPR